MCGLSWDNFTTNRSRLTYKPARLWRVGRSRSTRRKPMRSLGERTNCVETAPVVPTGGVAEELAAQAQAQAAAAAARTPQAQGQPDASQEDEGHQGGEGSLTGCPRKSCVQLNPSRADQCLSHGWGHRLLSARVLSDVYPSVQPWELLPPPQGAGGRG
ncbi:uncharacterized protein LOC144593880 [Rhinoraja longicauda]